MYKIAVLGNDNNENIKKIYQYSKNKDISIVTISNDVNSKLKINSEKLNIENKIIEKEKVDNFFSENFFSIVFIFDFDSPLKDETLKTTVFIKLKTEIISKTIAKIDVELIQNNQTPAIILSQGISLSDNENENLKKLKTAENKLCIKIIEELILNNNHCCSGNCDGDCHKNCNK